ncbi:multiple coagulation factor deficiency protein 2-like protein [Nephila pilipes]|uniref:Multiple coagulation factor deficiency protein 2-like protein n=1 Tax=Nephila pilipes TaxID=299642 RepID=A0A8X6QAE9_NEPPI|nr:multiple coagulation factor deficiency protein 2-like protein [Nephila pilipes]
MLISFPIRGKETGALKFFEISIMEVFSYVTLSLYVLFSLCGILSAQRGEDRHKGHTHHLPQKDGPKNVLKDKKYIQDYDHILEDLKDRYNQDFSDKLDEVELEIFYFQLHDLDNDKQLDGLELLAAMNHVMNRENEFPKEDIEKNPLVRSSLQQWWNDKFEEDAIYIDEILREEDLDKDGYLSYFEFALGRQKEKGDL